MGIRDFEYGMPMWSEIHPDIDKKLKPIRNWSDLGEQASATPISGEIPVSGPQYNPFIVGVTGAPPAPGVMAGERRIPSSQHQMIPSPQQDLVPAIEALTEAVKGNTETQKEGVAPDTYEGQVSKLRGEIDRVSQTISDEQTWDVYDKEFHPGRMGRFGRRIIEGKHLQPFREEWIKKAGGLALAGTDTEQAQVQQMGMEYMGSARRAMASNLARRDKFLKIGAGGAGFLGQAGMAGAAAHLDYELTSYEANLQTAQAAATGGGSVIGATIGGILAGPGGALVGGAIGGGAGKGLSDIIKAGHKEIVNAIKFSKEAGGGIIKELAAAGISLSDKQLDRIARDTLLTGTRMEAANERYVDRIDAVRDREGYEKAAVSQKHKFGPTGKLNIDWSGTQMGKFVEHMRS